MKQNKGQLTLFNQQESLKRDKVIDTIYDSILGFCCPKCGGFGRVKNLKYCPGCGQRLNLLSAEEFHKKYKEAAHDSNS